MCVKIFFFNSLQYLENKEDRFKKTFHTTRR